MKDRIIEILIKNSETAELINSGVYAEVVEDGKFENIAESIVKLFAIPDVVGQSEQLSCSTCKWLKRTDDYCDTCFKFKKYKQAT